MLGQGGSANHVNTASALVTYGVSMAICILITSLGLLGLMVLIRNQD